ncbi:MAG TPA: signal peptide peptidase SppA [Phycisphaerae bacterium]|nr:signal peptide peptidase SppA [Phycisphaerae bacterium]
MRKNSMTTQLTLLAAMLAFPPLLRAADDPPKSDKKSAKKQDDKKRASADDDKKDSKKTDDEEKKIDPVKRLIEIRIDPFLVPARAINVPLPGRIRTARELVESLEKLGKDDSVGAILLNVDGLALAVPDIEELRRSLTEFRASGKKVMAYLNMGEPNGYLLACAADEIAIAPSGSLALPGLGRVFAFTKGMMQLQGIEYDVITAGAYKYPGFVNSREPNKFFLEEMNQIMDDQFGDYVRIVAEGRKLSKEKVREIIDTCLFEPEDAKNTGLVDEIAYYEEYRERLLRRGKLKKGDLDGSDMSKITSLQDLLTQITKEMTKAQESYKAVGPKIAVLHARGPIVDMNLGSGFASSLIMRDEFVKSIEEIRKNKTIRGVVLRIDSPGGSAYASDVIWRKLTDLNDEKPVVVSMGTVAGSGGYYIACPGRLIFAEPTTITGSIGVIAMLANQQSAINRMDVDTYEMKRGDRALLGSGHREMRPEDRELIKGYILNTYEQFLDRVAEGRKMPKKEIRKLAGGRIYTGRRALEIGLVDRLGGLKDAIAATREMADIPASAEIKLVHYPRPSSFGELAESFFGISAMMEAAQLAQSPAAQVSFERQLRYFGSQPKALCWMGIPEFCTWTSPSIMQQAPLNLLGIDQDQPLKPFLTTP